jgi:enamine deaminase RidA (YjgF/YER057c/UK114 family)
MTDERLQVSSGTKFEAVMGYCRAVRLGHHVWVAGTAPQWPDGRVDPSPAAQARRCLEIVGDALEQAGASFADVVRTRIYLVDAADFDEIAAVHGETFASVRPVNTTVVVAALLDSRWRLELEVEALVDGSTPAPTGG